MNNFTNKYINDYKLLNQALVGIEVEFFSNHSYVKTVELLNLEFDNYEVWGINQYHSDFEVNDKVFKIEPDYSGGSEMIEFITGPLPWTQAQIVLITMLTWIKKYGYTDEHCSVHINVSLLDLDVKLLNPIKLILNINENYIYDLFPERRNNIYAKSVKWIVPFESWYDPEIAINHILQNVQIADDTKYYGINLQKRIDGYLEYRYIGGKDYHLKVDYIIELMNYFILQTRNAFNELTEEDKIKLFAYLEENINWLKQYKSYDSFLGNIDGIKIEVDREFDYRTTKNNWDNFKDKLFKIIKNSDNIKNATINYNSQTKRLEIVNATITEIHEIYNVDFIECRINNCTLYNCDIIETQINSGHLYSCNIYESNISNCKLMQCKCSDYTELINCLFDGGQLDCIMKNGVFRSGTVLTNAEIDNTVKMANMNSFWKVDPYHKKIKGLQK